MSRSPTPAPPVETHSADVTPGVELRETPSLGPEIYLDGNQSLTQVHKSALRAGFDDLILDALRVLPGSSHAEFRQVLDEMWRQDDRIDGTPLDGRLAHLMGAAAAAMRTTEVDDEHVQERVDTALRALHLLGTGNVDNSSSSREDVFATATLLREAGTNIPTRSIEVHLGVEWVGRRADQRADVVEWLSDIWPQHSVALVASRSAAARLVDAHRDIIPSYLTKACKRRCVPRRPGDNGRGVEGGAENAVQTRASNARDHLSVTGRPAAVVAAVAAVETHTLGYDELADALVLDGPSDGNLYQVVARLEETHGLVERLPRADGSTVVSLTPAGLTFIMDVYRESGIQTSLPGFVAGVSQPPQIHPPMPCGPRQARGTPPEDSDRDRDASAEAAATDLESSRAELNWFHGLVKSEFMGYERSIPLREASEKGNLVLQNSRIQKDDVDPRTPRVSVDGTDLLVEPGAYQNPMQFATTIAHGLAWEETRNRVLTPSDIDALLDGDLDAETLRDATGIGWLSDEADGVEVSDRLDEALGTLLFETGAYAGGDHDVVSRADSGEGFDDSMLEHLDGLDPDDDRELTPSEHRSLITSFALGLATTLVHLMDMAGIDVTLGVRIPECSRHFGKDDDENNERRQTLIRHLTVLSSLWSRYGTFNGFKQHYEHRDRKRSASEPDIDAEDPFGSLRAGIVVVGRGVESLSDELRQSLESDRDLHPEAPEFAISIDVLESAGIDASLQTARQMLINEKRMTPTAEAVSALSAFAADPWAIATAIHHGLHREEIRRDVHLDEVRRALAALPWNRLVEEPDSSTSTKRKAVKVLLDAEEPISAAEMKRRDGPSPQSWSDNRDRLIDLGLVEETPDGWRLTLPFRHERDATPDDERPEIPWFWQSESADVPGDLGREKRSPGDVIDWMLIDLGLLEDVSRLRDSDDPVGQWADAYYAGDRPDWSAMKEICAEIGVPWRVIAAGCDLRRPSPTSHTASVGPKIEQVPLTLSERPI